MVSLNLGGRNLNPLEFALDGDETATGQRAKEAGLRAEAVMNDTVGPKAMAADERACAHAILDAIYGSADYSYVEGLLDAETWATVYEQVSRDKPSLFNALNLATLQTGRPAPLEAPAICARFQTGEEWLTAWLAWYVSLDEATLPRADAARAAAKKGLSVQDAFAGLLIFDLFSMATVRHVFPQAPFSDIAAFTESLPFATYSGKHDAAASFFDKEAADLVFVQEARNLNDNPEMLRSFLEPFSGSDAFTSVLLASFQKNMFK